MLAEFREWLMFLSELYICWILTMEYFYDKEKDEIKRQRKTRTTKKTTTNKTNGDIVVEENTEILEPMNEQRTPNMPNNE